MGRKGKGKMQNHQGNEGVFKGPPPRERGGGVNDSLVNYQFFSSRKITRFYL
jgi:hypothetical protein